MELSDVLAAILKPTESDQDFQALRRWLMVAVVLAKERLDPASDPQVLAKHFSDLTPLEAQRLTVSLPPPASADVYSRLEALRRAQNAPDASAAAIYNGLVALLRQVDAGVRHRRRRSIAFTILKAAAYAGPVVLAYLAGTYFRLYNNLYWEVDTVISPPAAYSLKSGDYAIGSDYKTRFFREFSRFYFD